MSRRNSEPRFKNGDVVKLRNGLIGRVEATSNHRWRVRWTVITETGHRVMADDDCIEPLNAIERLAIEITNDKS